MHRYDGFHLLPTHLFRHKSLERSFFWSWAAHSSCTVVWQRVIDWSQCHHSRLKGDRHRRLVRPTIQSLDTWPKKITSYIPTLQSYACIPERCSWNCCKRSISNKLRCQRIGKALNLRWSALLCSLTMTNLKTGSMLIFINHSYTVYVAKVTHMLITQTRKELGKAGIFNCFSVNDWEEVKCLLACSFLATFWKVIGGEMNALLLKCNPSFLGWIGFLGFQ